MENSHHAITPAGWWLFLFPHNQKQNKKNTVMKNYIAILETELKKYRNTEFEFETLVISAETRQQAMRYARRIASVSCARVASLKIAK